MAPVLVAIARMRGPYDDAMLQSDPVAGAALASLFVLGIALPFLLLPVGSAALASINGEELQLETVLGRRQVLVRSARIGLVFLPGERVGVRVVLVRTGIRWLGLLGSGTWRSTPIERDLERRATTPLWRAHVIGWAVLIGWCLLAVILILLATTFVLGW